MKTLSKIILGLFFLFSVLCPLFSVAEAAVPHLINYQARLTDSSGQPLNGSYSLTFRIYDAETSGNLLWEETHSGVLIQKGIFSILLGSVTNLDLPFDKQYFLEIKVGNEVMSPRQQITSAGYAIRAESADLPNEVILMCKSSCPSGYKRIGTLDGKFLVGGQTYNPTAGGNNYNTLSVNNLPAHTHTIDHNHGMTGGVLLYNGTPRQNAENLTQLYDPSSPRTVSVHPMTGNSGSTGSGQPFDVRPEFATIVLCEKE